MKKSLKLILWFPLTIITVILFLAYGYIEYGQTPSYTFEQTGVQKLTPNYHLFNSVPRALGISTAQVVSNDAVPSLIRQYLEGHNSPMAPYSDLLVQAVRDNDLDDTFSYFFVALAFCESGLGKKMPPDCNNPFGYGIHSEGTLCFNEYDDPSLNWSASFNFVVKDFKKKYFDKGLKTPDDIMPKYCPESVKIGGPWAFCINSKIDEIIHGEF